MMKLRYWSHESPFIFPFTISKGTKTHQPALIVELENRGLKGYGEAPAISYYDVTVDKMIAIIEARKAYIEKYAFTEPERYWHYLHHLIPSNNFLVCALDIAAWDLYGQMRQRPLYQLWNYNYMTAPLTDYTIGIDSPDLMAEKVRKKPWPIYKIKLGSPADINIVKAIREVTDAKIRVDANAGWTREVAMTMIEQLQDYNIELIEQPLAKEDWEGMKLLKSKSRIPLIADESCVLESDVEKCLNHFDGINIKLTKCGGITPARRMISKARRLGMSVMIGCMNETHIGTAAIAHLLPTADYADADGPLLLQPDDRVEGLDYQDGRIIVSGNPGLGISVTMPD